MPWPTSEKWPRVSLGPGTEGKQPGCPSGTAALPRRRDESWNRVLWRTDWMGQHRHPLPFMQPLTFPVHSAAQVAVGLHGDWPCTRASHCLLGKGQAALLDGQLTHLPAISTCQRPVEMPGPWHGGSPHCNQHRSGVCGWKVPSPPAPLLFSIPLASLAERGRERPCTYWGLGLHFF